MTNLWARFWGFNWWVKGATIAVVIIFGAGIINSVIGSGGDDDSSNDGVIAPTATVAPTDAPDAPTEPALPAFTAAECSYANDIIEIMDDVGGASSDMGGLFLEAADDTLLIFDDDWRLQMIVTLATIRVNHDRFGELNPPDSMASIHAPMQSALSKLNDATELIAGGIDDVDPVQITEGANLFTSATADINATIPLIDDFGSTRSGEC